MIRSIDELETIFDSFAPSISGGARGSRLQRMRRLLSLLGNPEEGFRTYHVAGSKGKGTTAAYISALLTGLGRKCGLYASPHLFSVRERFTLSGSFFPDDLSIEACNRLIEMAASLSFPPDMGPEKPTTFEMYTAYAYLLFSMAGCTDAVIETGLGGRLDATNTIHPQAVFLTPIELEHTDVLGSTIAEIATEKSKIITPSTPVFSSFQAREAEEVFRHEAEAQHSPIYFLSDCIGDFRSRTLPEGEECSFTIDGRRFDLMLSMDTRAMAENAALAILGASRLDLLSDEGLRLLQSTTLPGRFERRMIEGHLVVVDTAHTVHSASSAREAFTSIAGEGGTLILALVDGKDEEGIVQALLPPFSKVIITKPGSYRRSDPERLLSKAKSAFPDKDIVLIEDADAALDSALSGSSGILITGSFYLPGEMRKLRKCYEP